MNLDKTQRIGLAALVIIVLTVMATMLHFVCHQGNSSNCSKFEPTFYPNTGLLVDDTNGYGLLITCPYGQEEYTERGGMGLLGLSGIYELKVIDKGLFISEVNIYVPGGYEIGVTVEPKGIITTRIRER